MLGGVWRFRCGTKKDSSARRPAIHDVDLELLRRHRDGGSVQNWNDRRKDLYKIVYSEGEAEHEI